MAGKKGAPRRSKVRKQVAAGPTNTPEVVLNVLTNTAIVPADLPTNTLEVVLDVLTNTAVVPADVETNTPEVGPADVPMNTPEVVTDGGFLIDHSAENPSKNSCGCQDSKHCETHMTNGRLPASSPAAPARPHAPRCDPVSRFCVRVQSLETARQGHADIRRQVCAS